MGMTAMMQDYLNTKQQYGDCLLFYRLGDFYEMFFDDAKTASRELELVLTGRDCGLKERAPMCGVPYHSAEGYIAKLVSRGYKVAICEQMEDPAQAKGLVRREVVRVVTPGTVLESSMLDESRNNYLCAVCVTDGAAEAGACFADCSTGEIHLIHITGEDVALRVNNEVGRFAPSEILVNGGAAVQPLIMGFVRDRLGVRAQTMAADYFDYATADRVVREHFGTEHPETLGLTDQVPAIQALGCVIQYLRRTQISGLERLNRLDLYSDIQYMQLDLASRRNLELLETLRTKEKHGSLLGVLDRTRTAMGKRLIRVWIERPLLNTAPIIERQDAVEELLTDPMRRGEIMEQLRDVYDLERIMTRIVYASANGRDLQSLAQTIRCLQPVKARLEGCRSALLRTIREGIDPLDDVRGWIESAIVDEPPFSIREGGVIRQGYNAEVDALQADMSDGKGVIARIEAEEKERTGIRTLKVGYNRVFGYYIEVSRALADQVPPTYIRKQTLANAERYITDELKQLETRVLGAKDRVVALEYQLFNELRMNIAAQLHRIQRTAQMVAQLDVLCSFAETANRRRYCRPTVDLAGVIRIQNGRHPVVEDIQQTPFVPNDTLLDSGDNRVAMITGPNMAGKSTYMRQVALIVLMAQIGCFVPADNATVGIVDSIFTRVGASDDLASGQSTFMVEMSEVATILHKATAKSLIVFDEIGRGTSTFDGMSIARAVLEYVADAQVLGAKTLFATHYHELTALEDTVSGVKNFSVAVKKRGDDITFLRRIVRGPADDSYGIEVAKLAGVPDAVVTRAKEILRQMEAEGVAERPLPRREQSDEYDVAPFTAAEQQTLQRLRTVDVDTLTPLEALQVLYDMRRQLADQA